MCRSRRSTTTIPSQAHASSGRARADAPRRALAVVDGLLGQPEARDPLASGPPRHERGGRARVDRHEVELVATDMDVPGQDGPTGVRQARRDQRLGGITRLLGRRPPRVVGSVRHAPHRRSATLIRDVSRRGCRAPATARSSRIEHRVVGHDRASSSRVSIASCASDEPAGSRQQVERQLVAGERPLEGQERSAMERRQAQLPDGQPMLERGVALVALPAVARDSGRPAGSIIRSRTTLATTEAQAIE